MDSKVSHQEDTSGIVTTSRASRSEAPPGSSQCPPQRRVADGPLAMHSQAGKDRTRQLSPRIPESLRGHSSGPPSGPLQALTSF
jgi:hypothetical protein